MNILITGFPGTGKSTIAAELKRRGRRAYDPEEIRGYAYVTDRQTGKHIHPPTTVPHGWFDTVGAQTWDPIKVKQLLATDEDTFICAFAHNLSQFYDLFDFKFILTLDDVELENRLLQRQGDRIGKQPEEIRDIMTLHHDYERSMIAHGAQPLNAAHGVPELVDQIIRTISQ